MKHNNKIVIMYNSIALYRYNLWCIIIIIPMLMSVNTIDLTCLFQNYYVHESVLIIANNIDVQILE